MPIKFPKNTEAATLTPDYLIIKNIGTDLRNVIMCVLL